VDGWVVCMAGRGGRVWQEGGGPELLRRGEGGEACQSGSDAGHGELQVAVDTVVAFKG
jgi:hypothetical protein